jgi:hypothetical protein
VPFVGEDGTLQGIPELRKKDQSSSHLQIDFTSFKSNDSANKLCKELSFRWAPEIAVAVVCWLASNE